MTFLKSKTIKHDIINDSNIVNSYNIGYELECSNEFVKKYARCPMKNGETCAAWCRKEDTPTHKFISQQEKEFFNESKGSNELPF